MAVALKSMTFSSQVDLTSFCADVANGVASIVSIVYNQDGKYILFYL